MKRIFFYLLASAVLTATAISCNKEQAQNEEVLPAQDEFVFTATTGEITRTTVEDGTGDEKIVKWAAGDQISVWWDGGSTTATAASTGTTTTFTAAATPATADYYYAAYPSSVATAFANDKLTVTVPAVQTGAFAAANIAVAKTTEDDLDFNFANITALVKFSVSGSTYTKAVFRGGKGETLAGTVPVDMSGAPTLGEVTDPAKEIEVSLNGAGEYYISVLPCTLEGGFSISLYEGGAAAPAAYLPIEVELARGTISALGAIDGRSITNYFVTPDGAGKKNGKNWENALGPDELRNLIKQVEGAAEYQASVLDGVTFHMAAGDYYLAEGETDGRVKMEFNLYSKQVAVTFRGGYPAGKTGTDVSGWTMPTAVSTAPTNCTAFTGNGEARILLFGNQTDITFEGITFKNAKLTANGGAVEAAAGETGNSTLTLTNCRIVDNENDYGYTGAGVYLSKADATITNCYFSGNKARNGAGLNLNAGDGTVVVNHCLFKGNKTDNTSGAMQNGSTKTVTVNDCTFEENANGLNRGNQTNIAGLGGAFHESSAGANTTFNRCIFANNSGMRGGAVSLQAGTLVFNNCQFTNNTATIGGKTNAGDSNETILGNHAGGAIVLLNANSDCTLNGCSFTTNSAPNGDGGAIAIQKVAAKLTIGPGNTFTSNTAYNLGGAIFARGGAATTITIAGTSGSKVTFTNDHTLATGNQHGNGGAIWLGETTTTTINYAIFDGCEAGQEEGTTVNYSNGGALCIKAVTSFSAENCEFTNCRGRNGGVLNIEAGNSSTVKFTSCSFHDNIGRSGASKDGTGGNFHGAVARFGSTGTAKFTNCTFKDNLVHTGGAVFHSNTANTVEANNCTFTGNKCSGDRGGAFTYENGTLKVTGGTISGGEATLGGVLYLQGDNSKVTFDGVTISGNKATSTDGGAIYMDKGTLTINNSTVAGNTVGAGHMGGAICINTTEKSACTFNATGTTFSSNRAGASTPSSDNDQGGAIRATGASGKVVTINLTDCVFSGNKSKRFGIAVSLNQYCYLKANRCIFTGNVGASRGVISLSANSLVFLNSCAFYNNTMSDATTWGMIVHGGNTPSAVCMNNCTSYNNQWTHSSPTGSCEVINGNEPVLVVNSTFIEKTGALLRASGSSVRLCNNILVNTKTAANIIDSATSAKYSNGHNAMSGSCGGDHTTDLTNCTISTFTGGQWDSSATSPYYGVYGWTGGGSLAGFTPAQQSDITGAISNFTQAVDGVGVSNAGTAFDSWLNEIEAYDKDGRGIARTGTWWPGAYQN